MNFKNDPDHYDQHFLIDDNIINVFLESACLNKNDIVIEVGPGKGNISSLIAKKVKKLYCIELDQRLKPYLLELKKNYNNIELIFDNFLNLELPKCNKVVTAIPYSIIEPFIYKMSNYNINIYMIMGRKYADKVINNDISNLSLLTNCFYNCRKIMDVTPDKFYPKPRVMSSIIELKYKSINEIDNNLLIFRFMYLYRNKKVKNALVESIISAAKIKNKIYTQRMSKNIINELNLDDNIFNKNFESISNEELKLLYNQVNKINL